MITLKQLTADIQAINPKYKKKNIRDYWLLIKKIHTIDPDAAGYLTADAIKLHGFTPESELIDCFYWAFTPQGAAYWSKLHSSHA